MIYPSMASLLKKVDSRYTLVIAASKRARMLTEGAQKLTDHLSPKDVTIAIHEISEGKVSYHRIHRPGVEEESEFVSESVITARPDWQSKRVSDDDDAEWNDEELLDDEHDSEEDNLDADEHEDL